MSADNALEIATLAMIAKGTDPSWRAGATAYLALVSSATPDEADPLATELTYTGYARVAVTKATAWSGTNPLTNAALIQFGKRTDAGATQTARSVVLVDTASGAVAMALIATIAAALDIGQNIQPQFEAGTISLTAE
jgi:hypothetical protein